MRIQDDVDVYVFGNGFDLACGLESRNSDFFGERFKKELACREKILSRQLNFAELNAWDLIFVNKYDKLHYWSDGEQTIVETVKTDSFLFSYLLNASTSGIAGKSCEQYRDICDTSLAYRETNHADRLREPQVVGNKTDDSSFLQLRNKQVNTLMNILLDDLLDEEKSFMDYLSKAVEKIDYDYRADALFQNIRNAHKEDREASWAGAYGGPGVDITPEIVILSFNYTNFYHGYTGYTFANVNGSLKDNNAIFGIPDASTSIDSPNWDFTKTNQSVVHAVPPSNRQIAMSVIQQYDKVNSISVFWHLLQAPDDSYFFNIFDKADVMNRHVPICFYFTETEGHPFDKRRLVRDARMLFVRYNAEEGSQRFSNMIHRGTLAFDSLDHSMKWLSDIR